MALKPLRAAIMKGRIVMKHPVDAHVGKRLRQRRWMVGKTQQQLGDAVGIKFQQIQKYETGMNRVSASRLWELANALDVPVSFFFDGLEDMLSAEDAQRVMEERTSLDGDRGGSVPPADILADKEALELIRAYYAIPEEQRRRLFELTRSLGASD